MRNLYLIYIFVFLLFIPFVSNVKESYYSLLLGNIRSTEVNKAITNLPQRQKLNILQMCLQMKNVGDQYKLTTEETAYLIFKWISQNIEVDCKNYDGKYQSALTTYNSGKGGFVGISNLFLTICLRLNIHSELINGYIKSMKNADGKIIAEEEHVWNLIVINDNNYLVNPTLGSGTCDGNSYIKKFNDFYFATKPEFFIRTHYPELSDYQLLDKPISHDEFKSMAFLRHYFYYNSFETINPDTNTISLKDDSTLTFTYDKSNTNLSFNAQYIIFDGSDYIYYKYNDVSFSNGVAKVSLNLSRYSNKICGLIVYAGSDPFSSTTYSIALFNVVDDSKKNLKS